ncbi:MAG: hypothetical protein EOP36_03780 [Rubrivivax sp.]|nr:MAG: hypothetical protein EOP36_03780 [Rubrivivax sp.]
MMVAALLAGCGGGSDPAKTGDDPTRQPAGSGGQASAAYLVTDVSTGLPGLEAHQLHLVDPATGAVFKTISVGAWSRYELAGPITPAANGQGSTQGDASVLFFIRQLDDGQRQLFQTPLVGDRAGTDITRISNLTDACQIQETRVSRLDAVASWLVVEVAGPDRLCDHTIDNQFVLVRSDWGSAEPARDSPFGRHNVLVWEYNALGELAWIYGYSARFGALGAINATTGDIRPVAGGVTGQEVALFSPYPGNGHKMVVRVGQTLRVLSWSDGDATLGPVIATLVNESIPFNVADDQGVYFVDGLTVRRIDPLGMSSIVATLPADGEVQYEGAQTPSSLLIVQGPGNIPASTGNGSGSGAAGGSVGAVPALPTTRLWSISKTGGAARVVETLPGTSSIFVAGMSGEAVVYGSRPSDDLNGGYVTLKRFVANDASQAPATVASGVRYLYGAGGGQVGLHGATAPSHLLWCEVAGQPDNCRLDRLRSYKLSTNQVVELGPKPSASVTLPSWDLNGDIDYVDSHGRGLLDVYVQDAGGVNRYVRMWWLVNLDQPQSLQELSLP